MKRAAAAESLQIPGVELAQVAPGTVLPEVLAGAVDHPIELVEDVRDRGLGAPGPEQLREQPGIAERPACEQHGRRAGLRERLARPLRVEQAAGDQHGHRQPLDQLARQGIVRGPRVALRGVARVDAEPGDASLVHQPVRERDAATIAGAQARSQLDRNWQAAATSGRARDRDGPVRVFEQRHAGAGFAHLRDRTAHVQVDQVGARRRDPLGRRGHHVRVGPEQLHRDRVLVGMNPQQLATGPLVAVVDGEARDHLRDDQAGAVAAGLETHEPVPDPCQGREHDTVTHAHAAQLPWIGQSRGARRSARFGRGHRGGHPGYGTNQVVDVNELLRPWAEVIFEHVPGLELFDAHTHLGENDPDGFKQAPHELLAVLAQGRARGAFVFPMHEPDGYSPANDMVLAAAGESDGLFVPFCRVSPHDGALAEAERALDDGARGIKLHPRAEEFSLDHPEVRDLVELAHERTLPVLIHAGRGIPALGLHAVGLARRFPNARLILAHAGISDLSWIWRVAPDVPNLLFDTAWWMPADLLALFSLVPPGQILFASDSPYGNTAGSAAFQLRVALQAGLSPAQIRSISSGQALRIARGEPLEPLGPAIGERERAPHILLDRVSEFLLLGTIATFRGTEGGPEMLALARLACEVPDEIDDASVFAAIRDLLEAYDALTAIDPDDRRRMVCLILALTVARTPDVPIPAAFVHE